MQAADGAHDMHADEGPCDMGPGFDNDDDDGPEPLEPMGATPSEAAPQRRPGGVLSLVLARNPSRVATWHAYCVRLSCDSESSVRAVLVLDNVQLHHY
jgi:hypothetical protein